RGDAAPQQPSHELVALDAGVLGEPEAVRLVRMGGVRRYVGDLEPRDAAELPVVALGLLDADAQELVEPADLDEADRSLDVGHAVVEAELVVLLDDRSVGLVAVEVRERHGTRPWLGGR